MSDEGNIFNHSGIISCVDDFENTYCIRKTIQLLSSGALLLLAALSLASIIHKQKVRQWLWLFLLILIIGCCLIINIIFCFFNADYWLFAIQTYFYNLYYLILVGYVAKSYLLKYRQIVNIKRFLLDPQNEKIKDKEKRIFYTILIAIAIIYTAILIASIILEVTQEKDHSPNSHCQQIWYLCFEACCLFLSFIVLYTLYKNQKEEINKIQDYQKQFEKRTRGSLVIEESSGKHEEKTNSDTKINNPLRSLWLWIILNVSSQLFNIMESLFYVESSPPQCLIIKDSFEGSNILELIFVFLTLYLCFASTLFYIAKKAVECQEHMMNRATIMLNEIECVPNIQLNPPILIKSPSDSVD